MLIRNEAPSTDCSRKLEPHYKGPFIVSKVLDKDRNIIEYLPVSTRTQRHYASVYASGGLKRWFSLPPEEDDSSSDEEGSESAIEDDVMSGLVNCKQSLKTKNFVSFVCSSSIIFAGKNIH